MTGKSHVSRRREWTNESEVFRPVTGVPLVAEGLMAAAVDLAGPGVKIFDTEDREVETRGHEHNQAGDQRKSNIRKSPEHTGFGN